MDCRLCLFDGKQVELGQWRKCADVFVGPDIVRALSVLLSRGIRGLARRCADVARPNGRAEACWLPIAPNLTPHGLRHTFRTMLVELGTPAVLIDDLMGHADGSVQARYTHITTDMRRVFLEGLTTRWDEALTARKALAATSSVKVLAQLLEAL